MLTSTIKWGILGTSHISEVMAKAIQASETSQLTAIASRSIETAKSFADQFSIRTFYDDYTQLLNDPDIDAVYVGLPNHLHKEWTIQCAQAGKHILCEKPFVVSIEEAYEVISVIENSNVICMEALMYRYHPFIQQLQEIIHSKIIGDVRLYNAVYTAHIADIANPTAGGSIRNLGCYPVSLVRLLAQAEPISIEGTGRFNQETRTDNQASVILKFPDDSIAVVSTADDIKMTWHFEVHGTNGYLKVITNPWLPSCDNNKILISLQDKADPIEINITAEKPLYTYQIDCVNSQINKRNLATIEGISLADSLGNTIVLETWLQQVVRKVHACEII